MVRKKDKALLAALAVFALVMAGIAIVGILLIRPAEATTQGQADCDAVRVSGKLPGRIVRFYVHEGDTVHKGDKLVSIYSSTVDAKYYQAQQAAAAAASQNQKAEKGTREELKQSAYNMWQQAIAAQTIAEKTYQRVSLKKTSSGYNAQLTGKTRSWADKVYPVRDTLKCTMDAKLRPLRYEKLTHEKDYYARDVVKFSYNYSHTSAHCTRYRKSGTTTIDLSAKAQAYDMLSVFYMLPPRKSLLERWERADYRARFGSILR